MKYDMLDKESVKRVLDTFEEHSLFINKKYEAFKSKDNYWSSDRDDREFKVARYFDADELKSRKRSERKNLIKTGRYLTKENVTVMAKDSEEAMNKCTNAIEVEAC